MIMQHWSLPTPSGSPHTVTFGARNISGVADSSSGPIFYGDTEGDIGDEVTSLVVASTGTEVSASSYRLLGVVDYGGVTGTRYVFIPK